MTIKGKLNTEGIKREQGFNLIREYLKGKSLNSNEDLTISELVDKIETELADMNTKWVFAQNIFNKTQKIKVLTEFTSEDDLNKLIGKL